MELSEAARVIINRFVIQGYRRGIYIVVSMVECNVRTETTSGEIFRSIIQPRRRMAKITTFYIPRINIKIHLRSPTQNQCEISEICNTEKPGALN